MYNTEAKELTQAKKLIEVSKLDEAEKIIEDFELKGGTTHYERVFCHFLKCKLLLNRGSCEEVVKLAKQTYKESLVLGKNFLSVDILLDMILCLLRLGKTEKAFEIIKQGEDLLKTLTPESSTEYKQREAYIAFLKGWAYDQKSDIDQALKQFELSLSLREELGIKNDIAQSLVGIAHVFLERGEFDHALKSLEQSKVLAKEGGYMGILGHCLHYFALYHIKKGELDRSIMYSERCLKIYNELNNKFMLARVLNFLGGTYMMKGELDHSISIYKKSLDIFKEFNNKLVMGFIFNSLSYCYKMKGELDYALECIEQSMILNREVGSLRSLANNYDYLITILIDRGDIERAKNSLRDLEQLSGQLKDRKINLTILFNKALVLKTSSRALNRGKAEEILKQLLEKKDLDYEDRSRILLNLCDLLLTELSITNEKEVLEEIKPLITELLNLSEKSQSFWILGETYLLQAKLTLISLNLEEAQKLLTKGQKIAEKYGLNNLAIKISNEHDELLKQLEKWESIKDSNAPLAERIELSHLNEQIEGMVKRRVGKIPKLVAEHPVLLVIMSRQGNVLLSNPFTADIAIESGYFSEFLSSCNTFFDQILSESFDRLKFGQHTVLVTAVDSFSICYIFKGQTYSARQKLLYFSETVRKDPFIMKILEDASKKNIEIKVNETFSLEELISESFLSDPQQFQMPFKAYKGEEPFVFVSYSHTDRLQVYPIIDYLNRTGINIWYDEGIPISENWKKSIVQNLERCQVFLVFITPHIIVSEMVRKEISFALKKKKKFIAIYLKETNLPSELEFEIADIQALMKYRLTENEFYNKLKETFALIFSA